MLIRPNPASFVALRAAANLAAAARCYCADCQFMLNGSDQSERPEGWEMHLRQIRSDDDFTTGALMLVASRI